MRWQDTYAVGELVEIRVGEDEWRQGTIVRRTLSKLPIVSLVTRVSEAHNYAHCVDRKTMIRKLPKEPHV